MTTLSGPLRRAGIFVSALAVFFAPLAASANADSAVARYGEVLRSFNRGFSASQSQDMAAHVLLLSSYYSLDPRLLVAIIGVESSWHTRAVSPAGAQGLGQLMPATASGLGVLAFDAYENLDGTARYLRRMMQNFAGVNSETRYTLALASYNAGSPAVARFGGVPPFAETRAYVTRVMSLWHNLQTRLPGGGVAPRAAARTAPPAVDRVASRPAIPSGSVAEFAQLEAQSMQAFLAETPVPATPLPIPTRESKSVKGWFARAFGPANHAVIRGR
jgi:hypothetical protein